MRKSRKRWSRRLAALTRPMSRSRGGGSGRGSRAARPGSRGICSSRRWARFTWQQPTGACAASSLANPRPISSPRSIRSPTSNATRRRWRRSSDRYSDISISRVPGSTCRSIWATSRPSTGRRSKPCGGFRQARCGLTSRSPGRWAGRSPAGRSGRRWPIIRCRW